MNHNYPRSQLGGRPAIAKPRVQAGIRGGEEIDLVVEKQPAQGQTQEWMTNRGY